MIATTPDRSVTALVGTVLVGYALFAYAAIAPGLNLAGAVLGLVLALGVVAVQLGYVSRPGVRRTREGTALAVLALACLVYVPVVALGVGWIGFAGFLAGSLLVLLGPRVGLAGLAAVVLSVALLAGFVGSAPVLPVVTSAVGTAITGLVIAGLTRLWQTTAQRPSAEPATVEPERVEPAEPAEDPEEGAEHDDRADWTALAVGLAAARTELDAAEVELSVLGDDVELPEEVGTLFAALLRVAVGHAARHADTATCQVTVVRRDTEARIVVTHDGATDDPDPDDFEALGERFDAADGSALAERDDEQFTVEGRLPIDDGRAGQDAPGDP